MNTKTETCIHSKQDLTDEQAMVVTKFVLCMLKVRI